MVCMVYALCVQTCAPGVRLAMLDVDEFFFSRDHANIQGVVDACAPATATHAAKPLHFVTQVGMAVVVGSPACMGKDLHHAPPPARGATMPNASLQLGASHPSPPTTYTHQMLSPSSHATPRARARTPTTGPQSPPWWHGQIRRMLQDVFEAMGLKGRELWARPGSQCNPLCSFYDRRTKQPRRDRGKTFGIARG